MTSDQSLAKSTLFWTIVAAVAAVLALFLDPVRTLLGFLVHGIAAGAVGGWTWLMAPHGVRGWLFALLLFTSLPVLYRLLVLIFTGKPGNAGIPISFTRDLNGVRWRGQIAQTGTVVGLPLPYCPHCQCRIHPTQGWNYQGGGGYFTRLRCDDCGRTNQTEPGTTKNASNRASRRIEAQWERGELKLESGQ